MRLRTKKKWSIEMTAHVGVGDETTSSPGRSSRQGSSPSIGPRPRHDGGPCPWPACWIAERTLGPIPSSFPSPPCCRPPPPPRRRPCTRGTRRPPGGGDCSAEGPPPSVVVVANDGDQERVVGRPRRTTARRKAPDLPPLCGAGNQYDHLPHPHHDPLVVVVAVERTRRTGEEDKEKQ